MSFLSILKKEKINDNVSKSITPLFSYMSSITPQNEALDNFVAQLNKLNKKNHKDSSEFIKLYLIWEEFILDNKAIKDKNVDKESFRSSIREHVPIETLNLDFRLLFFPPRLRALYLYEYFMQLFAEYIIANLSFEIFKKTIEETAKGTLFANVELSEKGFDFRKINEVIKNNNTDYPIFRITQIFKGFLSVLYTKIEVSLGTKLTEGLFKNLYENIQKSYDTDVAATLLKVTPEKVLNLDTWLSLLSKNELEKQVKDKTRELENLNLSLEDKVAERTKELKEAYERLKELDKKKSEFISVAAHQLRTPSSGLKWTFNMLLNGELGELNEEQKAFIDKSAKTNDQMIGIINDLLNTDTIATEKIVYDVKEIDLYKIVENVMFQVSQQARNKGVVIELPKKIPNLGTIEGDEKKITIVVQNLLDNAIKYTKPRTAVKIDIKPLDNTVELTVEDQGIGIPKTAQNSIFERFYRADNAIRTHANGSGLGLFIAKGIVEDHGGSISYETEQNVGTKFIVVLPKKQNKAQ